jgi:hypothetical protein
MTEVLQPIGSEQHLNTWPVYSEFYQGYSWAFLISYGLWGWQDLWLEPASAFVIQQIVAPAKQFLEWLQLTATHIRQWCSDLVDVRIVIPAQ